MPLLVRAADSKAKPHERLARWITLTDRLVVNYSLKDADEEDRSYSVDEPDNVFRILFWNLNLVIAVAPANSEWSIHNRKQNRESDAPNQSSYSVTNINSFDIAVCVRIFHFCANVKVGSAVKRLDAPRLVRQSESPESEPC